MNINRKELEKLIENASLLSQELDSIKIKYDLLLKAYKTLLDEKKQNNHEQELIHGQMKQRQLETELEKERKWHIELNESLNRANIKLSFYLGEIRVKNVLIDDMKALLEKADQENARLSRHLIMREDELQRQKHGFMQESTDPESILLNDSDKSSSD